MRRKKPKINTKNKSYSLQDCALYKCITKKRLVKILKSDLGKLKNLSRDIDNYTTFYEKTDIQKKRLIERPNEELDVIHTRIASLLCRVTQPDFMHSGLKLHSHVSNAKKHIGVHPLLTTDLKSFFPSTSKAIVFNFFFKKLLCSPDVSELLSNLCTYNNHIPTGSRISMPLAYWANSKMFLELNALSKALGICMTVYVDDITFSGRSVNKLFKSKVNKIIESHSHIMHPVKTILYKPYQNKLVTGVIVSGDNLRVRNKQLKDIHVQMKEWENSNLIISRNIVKERLLGRLNSASTIDIRFKDKARTLKKTR